MDFQQNQITLATTKTGYNSNNYNRRRNLFRLVFFEQRSHGEGKNKLATNEIIYTAMEIDKTTTALKHLTIIEKDIN